MCNGLLVVFAIGTDGDHTWWKKGVDFMWFLLILCCYILHLKKRAGTHASQKRSSSATNMCQKKPRSLKPPNLVSSFNTCFFFKRIKLRNISKSQSCHLLETLPFKIRWHETWGFLQFSPKFWPSRSWDLCFRDLPKWSIFVHINA